MSEEKVKELIRFIESHKQGELLAPVVNSGLKNVIRRIYLTYGTSSEVEIESINNLTKVKIIIDLEGSCPGDQSNDY